MQVDLSDFPQIWEVRFLGEGGGVDRLFKSLEKVSEGKLELDIPLNIGQNITLFMGLETRHATAYTTKLRIKFHQANISLYSQLITTTRSSAEPFRHQQGHFR